MKRTMIIAALIIAASVFVNGQASDARSDKDNKTKREAAAIAAEFTDALVKRDIHTMERILSDDYGDVSNGLPTTKSLLIRAFKEQPTDAAQLAAIDLDPNWNVVHLYGDTAVIDIKADLKWKGSKELAKKWGFIWPVSDSDVVTLVAVKRNGGWQIVSTHASEFLVKLQVARD
jgi:SnoaL-like protein